VNANGTFSFFLQGLKRRQDKVFKQCPVTVSVPSSGNSNQTILILESLLQADISIIQVQKSTLILSIQPESHLFVITDKKCFTTAYRPVLLLGSFA